ncbi:ribonuclease III domain-containing protein [Russula earlei]|uniref:Ribonuclease III domain-containing protein n=1 Tax=Russula earlei TaxID=71964 RepID=A0ACC0UNI9_9AGAM|nr:ribonuclease III domain-containing protein [Russula earlei]
MLRLVAMPYTRLGRPYHGFVLARFKYSAHPRNSRHKQPPPPPPPPPTLPDHDAKAIQDIIAGLRLMSLLKPDFGPGGLPPLPKINSSEVEMRVFTHRSFAARPTHVFEDSPEDPSPDNEQLEHVGDQVLGLIVTDLLQSEFPYLRVGPSTKMRALVVGNSTLATIAVQYKLPERLRLHRAQSVTLKASTHVQADVFESYVGGLYKDQGLGAVKEWLDKLFTPYVREAYRIVREQHGLLPVGSASELDAAIARAATHAPPTPPPESRAVPAHSATLGHLGLFNQRLQQHNKPIEWIFDDTITESSKSTPFWAARALVDGECWGVGRGSNKKAAKNEAAKQGLRRMGFEGDY